MTSPEDDLAHALARVEELRRAVEARDAFIAVAAHELRNPMTPIMGRVQLLLAAAQRDGVPPGVLAGLERLDLAVRRYVKRATVLLETTRIAAGAMRLQPTRFDLAELVREVVRDYAPFAKRARSPVEMAIQRGVEGCWDRLAVEQVLDNLLSNAIKHGAGAPVRIDLACDTATARLSVRDRGPGVAAEDQARIFDRFEQTAHGRERRGGFGVGLWVARGLVAAMGGTISVQSEPGAGATFTVTLPRQVPQTEQTP